MNKFILLLAGSLPWLGYAQQYSIDWHAVAGGGGTSTGGPYQIAGTLGQPEAGGITSGGSYTLTGGFWSLISVMQTIGAPRLKVTYSGNNAIISWPSSPTGFALQQRSDLTTGNWSPSDLIVSDDGTTKRVTIATPKGNLFLRLNQ